MDFSSHLFFSGTAAPAMVRRERVRRTSRPLCLPGLPTVESLEASRFFAWLFAQAGLDAACYRPTPLVRRLPSCLRLLRAQNLQEARQRLEQNPALIGPTVSTALLGVTRFRRDDAVFAAIAEQVLPDLLAKTPRVRIWSAACSEGPELYSVAMLLDEAGRLTRAELLGTDCRADAIRRAEAGLYPVEALGDFGPTQAARHFVSAGPGRVQVARHLRASAVWRVSDLIADVAAGPWDLVLWRNMAIYLAPVAAERVWRSIASVIRPGGYLVTGKADHPPLDFGWQRVAACVYQKPEAGRGA